MKQLTSYVRAVGYLNKLFDLLNERFFDSELIRPTITIQSSPRAFGHFSLRGDTWKSLTGDSFEINIGAGTLSRPIELTATTLYHEMVHLFCATHGLKDCSNNYVYHNGIFKREAESHGGAIVEKDPSGRYGWTITKPSEEITLPVLLEIIPSDIQLGNHLQPNRVYCFSCHIGADMLHVLKIFGVGSGFLAMDNDHSLIFLAIKLDIPCLSSRFIQRKRLL